MELNVNCQQQQPVMLKQMSEKSGIRLQSLEQDLLSASAWDATKSEALKSIVSILVDTVSKVNNEFEIALVLEGIIRVRQF